MHESEAISATAALHVSIQGQQQKATCWSLIGLNLKGKNLIDLFKLKTSQQVDFFYSLLFRLMIVGNRIRGTANQSHSKPKAPVEPLEKNVMSQAMFQHC